MPTLPALKQGVEALFKGELRPSRLRCTIAEPQPEAQRGPQSEKGSLGCSWAGGGRTEAWRLSSGGCGGPSLRQWRLCTGPGPKATPPPAHLPGLRFLPSRVCSPVCSEEGNCKLIFISILEENLNSPH